jgi:acyl-CoA synthetase (NDP forming)
MLLRSGYCETATAEGRELERTIAQVAQEANLPLIGPHCLGLFHSTISLRNFPEI